MAKVGLYAIGKSTPPESNKSPPRMVSPAFDASRVIVRSCHDTQAVSAVPTFPGVPAHLQRSGRIRACAPTRARPER